MKMRYLLLTLVGLVSSYALPTFGQDKTTVDPEVRQQIEAVLARGDEAFNKQDASAFADRYTDDAVLVGGGGGSGPHYGKQGHREKDCARHGIVPRKGVTIARASSGV
jgi:hypothetical protein